MSRQKGNKRQWWNKRTGLFTSSQCVLGSTPASDQVYQISRRPPLLCQCAMSVRSCVSTVLTTTYQAGGSTVTDYYSSGRMGLGLQNMVYDLCWALGQGLSCMFVSDCEDMLGGGRDALWDELHFSKDSFSLAIVSWWFSEYHCGFWFVACCFGRCSQLARLAHLIAIFSTNYLSSLYLCKSWTGAWTFGFLLYKAIKTAMFPSG